MVQGGQFEKVWEVAELETSETFKNAKANLSVQITLQLANPTNNEQISILINLNQRE